MERISDQLADSLYIILYQWGDDGNEELLASSINLPCEMVRNGLHELIDMELMTVENHSRQGNYRLHWQPVRY